MWLLDLLPYMYIGACLPTSGFSVPGNGPLFARQRDVIIRSDVTSGVHPPNAFFSSLLQW